MKISDVVGGDPHRGAVGVGVSAMNRGAGVGTGAVPVVRRIEDTALERLDAKVSVHLRVMTNL